MNTATRTNQRFAGLPARILAGLTMAVALTSAVLAQGSGAKIHGHVLNPAGMALKAGDVRLTTDAKLDPKDRTYKYTFPIDQNGEYKGDNINPGDYIVVVTVDKKNIDYQNQTLRVGDDKTLDFDMSRAEYLKSMSAEDRAALEEYKKKNAGVAADNAKIANMNKTMADADALEKAGKGDDAVALLKDLPPARPTEPILWAALGQAQLKAADQAAAAAGKGSATDSLTIEKYAAAAASFQKAIDNAPNNKKVTPEILSAYYLNLGRADSKSNKMVESAAAYEASAKAAPAMAGQAYLNEAIVMYTAGKNPETVAAADKAIAADPKKADAYYLKAQALIPGAKTDASGKYVLPPGCLEAYQEYLELAPDGPHATEIKEILQGLGQPVKNSFKAGKH